MRRFYAWLLAQSVALQLRLRESPHWRGTTGWVVMGENLCGDWHAMSGGEVHGMDTKTGRFRGRQLAQNFADCRNRAAHLDASGSIYYVTHEDLLQRPLPPRY